MKWISVIWRFLEQEYEAFLRPPESPKMAPVVVPITQPKEIPMPEEKPVIDPDSIVYPWDTPQHIYHNVRVLCDNAGLTFVEKNLICACIYRESEFKNNAVCYNRDSQGNILSTDFGICQINSYYHCAPTGSPFPSPGYVVANPDKCAQYMIDCYRNGTLKMWVSYSSGAYAQFLLPDSPMWLLATV